MAPLDSLTDRQIEILRLVSDYHTNREIADELSIAESTVESHLHHILQKLFVQTRNSVSRLYREAPSTGTGYDLTSLSNWQNRRTWSVYYTQTIRTALDVRRPRGRRAPQYCAGGMGPL